MDKMFRKGMVEIASDDGILYGSERNYDIRRVISYSLKEGDAVFILDTSGVIRLAKISKLTNMFIYIIDANGIEGMWEENKIKPFSADKIGKPWDEI